MGHHLRRPTSKRRWLTSTSRVCWDISNIYVVCGLKCEPQHLIKICLSDIPWLMLGGRYNVLR